MGPPGVAMGAEHQMVEGRPHEKQGMGWGMWGAGTGPGSQAAWPRLEQDTHRSHEGRMGRVTPSLGTLYISKFYAFNLRKFAI